MTQRAARMLHHHDILASRGEPRDLVAPDDFDLAFKAAMPPEEMPPCALAYCADFITERVLYTVLPQPRMAEALGAAFLYSAQLQRAASVITVPFERLADLPGATADIAPVLIFSPGRTGSTLLSRLLNACGRSSASEPDLPTQLCRLDEEGRARLTPVMEHALVRAAMVSLASHLGRHVFVKLRSQCNARPDVLLEPLPQAVPVFLFRRHRAWALSRHRAFAEPPDMVADILRTAMVAVDRLARIGRPPRVIWFEDMRRDPAGFLVDLLETPHAPHQSIAHIMEQDSQAGTGLARDVLNGRDVDAAFLAGFEAEWAERRPAGPLGRRLASLLEAIECGDDLPFAWRRP